MSELTLAGGVVALPLQGGAELDGGDEEAARFADGFEVAIHLDGSGAVAVAEHAPGHRTQQAPACGRGVAELITYGQFRSLDLSRLTYERIAKNEPLLERAVI